MSESSGEFFFKSSELFESPVYLEEAADVLCILQAGTVMTAKIPYVHSFLLNGTVELLNLEIVLFYISILYIL